MENAERRKGRAEGLRMAASLLRSGDLLRDAADVLSSIADEEEPDRDRAEEEVTEKVES